MTNPLRPVILAAQRALCATRGHDTLLHIEPHRLSLRCVTCGHETTGWMLAEPAVRGPAAAALPPRAEVRHAV